MSHFALRSPVGWGGKGSAHIARRAVLRSRTAQRGHVAWHRLAPPRGCRAAGSCSEAAAAIETWWSPSFWCAWSIFWCACAGRRCVSRWVAGGRARAGLSPGGAAGGRGVLGGCIMIMIRIITIIMIIMMMITIITIILLKCNQITRPSASPRRAGPRSPRTSAPGI